MKKSMEWIAILAFVASFNAFADETGHGTPGADPDGIHDPGKPHIPPETSDPSTESTDIWWNDLLELFDLDSNDEE